MNELEKLKILLPHFIEHSLEHVKTFEQWEEKLKALGLNDKAEYFRKAALLSKESVEELKKISL